MDHCEISKRLATKIELNDIWGDLEAEITFLYESKCMPKEKYSTLYSHVYNLCAIKNPRNNGRHFTTRKSELRNGNKNKVRTEEIRVVAQLYERFQQFLNNYVRNLSKNMVCKNENDLKLYVYQWEDYRCSSKILNKICGYMNRYWFKKESDEEQKKLNEMYQLALTAWNSQSFRKVKNCLSLEILKLIERERAGELIDEGIVIGAINSFVEMGLLNPDGEYLKVYQNNFEKLFLQETEQFYIQKETTLLKNTTATDYLKKVDEILQEEEDRLRRYLHKSTWFGLATICKNVLIVKNLDYIQSNFVPLLENEDNDELGRMYSLLEGVSDGLTNLIPLFENYVKSEALLAIKKCCKSALIDPKMYGDTILEIHRKYQNLISSSFGNHQGFSTALDKACDSFVNSNAVTQMANSSAKSATLLIRYCDILLKQSNNNLEQIPPLKDTINEIVSIFKYVEDKELFQLNYSKMLAKRVVQQNSFDYKVEMDIIAKLRVYSGPMYTDKLEKMLSDSNESKMIMEEFLAGSTASSRLNLWTSPPLKKIEFSAQVFDSRAWPLKQFVDLKISLPSEFKNCIASFDSFYHKKFAGRKLSWSYAVSTGELQMNCAETTKRIQVTTYQMVVLLQFNDKESWTVKQLTENTFLRSEVLVRAVQGLLKAELLTCKGDDLSSHSLVSLVNEYKSDKICINLIDSLKMDWKTEVEAYNREAEANRNFRIQAAIVRIMKQEREMEDLELIVKVCENLSIQLSASYHDIKRCIDFLVESGYIAPCTSVDNAYCYVP